MLLTFSLLFAGVLMTGYALLSQFRRRKFISGGINGIVGFSLAMAGGFFSLLLLNIQTYQQLTREVKLAEISVGKKTAQGVPVRLFAQQLDKTYLIDADEWRLDARFLKWKPWMSLIGKDPVVRLESFEERNGRNRLDRMLKHYDLVTERAWLDGFVTEMSQNMGLIDSLYGSSVYMPIRDGARYEITASLSGLVARPLNPQAKSAVIEWSSN
jgi:hypothetical protein